MKIYRESHTFNPRIWEAEIVGKRYAILVCGDSCRDTGGTENEFGGRVVDELCHPVAIRLGTPSHVIYGFKDTSHDWLVRTVEEVGMSRCYAQLALAEAWRGVESVGWGAFPQKVLNFHFRVNRITRLADCDRAQERTMFRNLNAWVLWSKWEMLKMTSRQRSEELSAMGIPASAKHIDKIAENVGL